MKVGNGAKKKDDFTGNQEIILAQQGNTRLQQ